MQGGPAESITRIWRDVRAPRLLDVGHVLAVGRILLKKVHLVFSTLTTSRQSAKSPTGGFL